MCVCVFSTKTLLILILNDSESLCDPRSCGSRTRPVRPGRSASADPVMGEGWVVVVVVRGWGGGVTEGNRGSLCWDWSGEEDPGAGNGLHECVISVENCGCHILPW